MWAYEHEGVTTAAPAAVWAVLADLDRWDRWDTSMEWVRLSGDLAVGPTVQMKPIEQDEPITSTITEVSPERRYADRTEFGGLLLDFSHDLFATDDGGTRVVHRLEISGEGAEEAGPTVGPQITSDFPEAMAALFACVGE